MRRLLRPAIVGTVIALLGAVAPAVAEAATLTGIDVSKYQGSISWGAVASDGVKFAFIKATDGRATLDPNYTQNANGARNAGVRIGAYHFARPDGTPNDAVLEARFFVANAVIEAGTLPPVLDIEETGGLGPVALTQWALDFLEEVRSSTGVRALVYTSPNGWKVRFGNTDAVAKAGYDLWVADWRTNPSPEVPGGNWAGRGWTFWQYTDCGRVSGIATCVDMDRFNGSSLNTVTLRSLSVTTDGAGTVTSDPAGIDCGSTCELLLNGGEEVSLAPASEVGTYLGAWGGACSGIGACTVRMTANRSVSASFVTDTDPPTASVVAPKTVSGPLNVRFNEVVTNVTADDVVLKRKKAGVIATSLTCKGSGGATVDCASGLVKAAILDPVDDLEVGATYIVIVNGVSPDVVDRALNPVAPTSASFVMPVPVEVEESDASIAYAWKPVKSAAALGGSYVVEEGAGASASYDFTGPSVQWNTIVGPTMGTATVTIDGRSKGTFDLSASTLARSSRLFQKLGDGDHTITITATGDDLVAVDGFKVGTLVDKTPVLSYAWSAVSTATASGGKVARSALAGTVVSFEFVGSGISWITQVGPDQGIAKVFIDGVLVRTFDNYAAAVARIDRSILGLASGSHTVRIVVTGTKRSASSATWITIDGFTPR